MPVPREHPEPAGEAAPVAVPRLARGWWRWASLAVLGMVVVELVARIEDRVSDGIPLASRVRSANDLIWLHPDGARGRPNARYRRWALNSRGFRAPEFRPTPAPGTARVVTLGASETFGLYESRGHDYSSQLQDSLRQRWREACGQATRGAIEVINTALPGMAFPTMTRYLDRMVRPVEPGVLVLYPSPGFYLNARAPSLSSGAPGADSTLPARNVLASRTRERLVTQVKAMLPDAVMAWARRTLAPRRQRNAPVSVRFATLPADRLAQFERDLRETAGMAKSLGAPVVLMGHANATMQPGFDDPGLVAAWVYQFPHTTGAVLSEFHRRAVAVERQVAADSGLVWVDLPAAFDGRWAGSFADFVHFTDQGAAVVAGALAGAVVPLLSCPTGQAP